MDAAEQTDLGPGTMVDHFKVDRLVGRGGMGEVYLARDTKLGRKVALKLVHPDSLGDQQAVERFLHEARTTARFSHPHIVRPYCELLRSIWDAVPVVWDNGQAILEPAPKDHECSPK